MMPNVTYIDDLLDLDDPAQKGAYSKIANRNSIKSLPDPNGSVPNGKLIESFTEQPGLSNSNMHNIHRGSPSNINEHLNIRGPGHSGFNHREQFTYGYNTSPGMGPSGMGAEVGPSRMGPPGMGPPGMGPPGMGQPGMGQPGMGPPGMGAGMGPPGMGPPGMGAGMGPPGMRSTDKNLMSPPREAFQSKMPRIVENFKPELSCRDLADHIGNCPVCSKLYKQKRTGYIIAIIVLVIINLILLNKVFSSL